ncbi:uncharacterized protein N0V89_001843 [Didymosphaeria variabile]|uniref:Uncharacterized protein n=1 Tax=Didymosphaeria variabile TaxID=1932322 RepID=A0A9W8XSD5_9PLEO|nr:uncharacterized protein N0V89_001843 [Didymosphaeria variabile]KAJ4357268.1 hypothetical protein N0V89_001843 [Didymosphaeria variabile]
MQNAASTPLFAPSYKKRDIEDGLYVFSAHSKAIRAAKVETLLLTRRMQSSLPRELRDLVWDHYWDFGDAPEQKMAEKFIAVADNLHNKWRRCEGFDTCVALEYQEPQCRLCPGIPTALLPLFVGPDTAFEAAERMYKYMVLSVDDIVDLPRHLYIDTFQLGVNAATSIRRIQMCTKTSTIRSEAAKGRLSFKKLRDISRTFEALLHLRNRSNLSVSLAIKGTGSALDLEMILDAFSHVYQPLRHSACSFEITAYVPIQTACLILFQDDQSLYEWLNVGDFWDMPLDVWRERHQLEDRMISQTVFMGHEEQFQQYPPLQYLGRGGHLYRDWTYYGY